MLHLVAPPHFRLAVSRGEEERYVKCSEAFVHRDGTIETQFVLVDEQIRFKCTGGKNDRIVRQTQDHFVMTFQDTLIRFEVDKFYTDGGILRTPSPTKPTRELRKASSASGPQRRRFSLSLNSSAKSTRSSSSPDTSPRFRSGSRSYSMESSEESRSPRSGTWEPLDGRVAEALLCQTTDGEQMFHRNVSRHINYAQLFIYGIRTERMCNLRVHGLWLIQNIDTCKEKKLSFQTRIGDSESTITLFVRDIGNGFAVVERIVVVFCNNESLSIFLKESNIVDRGFGGD